jgi:AcrR family transcriptional regulator
VSLPAADTKPKRAAALPPDERRSMIIAATLPLLVEYGERVTSRQIAEAAGIAEGTIFRAFTDKEELVAAAVESALDEAPLEAAIAAIPVDDPFVDQLRAAIAILQERTLNIWRLVSSLGTRPMARRPMADSNALVAFFADHRDKVSVEPVVAARSLRALTLASTHPMLANEPMSADDLLHLFLDGVGVRKDPSC